MKRTETSLISLREGVITDEGNVIWSEDPEQRLHGRTVTVYLYAPENEWVLERTVRLLPEVLTLINQELMVPRLEIVLTNRRGVAREVGRRRAIQRNAALPWGWRFHLQRSIYTIKALRTPGTALGTRMYHDPYGNVQLDVAVASSEKEWGALLTEQITRATLMAAPGRERHLGQNPIRWPETTLSYAKQRELRAGLMEAEHRAVATMTETWRERYIWTGPAVARAEELLDELERGVVPPVAALDPAELDLGITDEHNESVTSVLESVYKGHEPFMADDMLESLFEYIGMNSTKAEEYMLLDTARINRLSAAAFLDYRTLQTTAAGENPRNGELEAFELAWHLAQFDIVHGTQRGKASLDELRRGLFDEQGAALRYVRQEWTAWIEHLALERAETAH